MKYSLFVNGKKVEVEALPDTPLLWVLRDSLGLLGTKYSCGIGECGCCTVHLDGEPIQSCSYSLDSVNGKNITTIEGLAAQKDHPLLEAWFEENVSQCGFCQPGQIMTAAALLAGNPHPSDEEIDDAMSGNICRCGTYQRIQRAIHRASETWNSGLVR